MPRMTPAERREAIIEAALRVMVGKGMAATTVRDVAHDMGTSSGLIHHYFESMDDLLAAAFDRAAGRDLDATRTTMTRGAGPVEQLSIFFATYVRAEQDWAFQLWLDAWAEAARRPAVRETSQRLNVAWQQLLAETIRAGVEHGVMACGDPEAAAWCILSLLDGLALQAVAHRLPLDRRVVITWSVAYAEAELSLPSGSLGCDARQ
ncbi:MAG: TetR family transcriptional regulator C-terminal domain-containing protein [Nocardioidaceae bacterium]|nr:TetR family transcriptional regulator C-terminal domain-containing protein [Nocardioidaceae bacterium]